jgi:hypothetical protein
MFLAGAFVVAAAVTLVFLGMRAVMDIGGACAEGGPYVPARPCPEGTFPAMFIGIPAWFAGTGLLVAGGASLGGRWSAGPILAWSGLFGALGWNFLEFAFDDGGPEWGWLICGIVFEAMAIVPLLVLLPIGRISPGRAAALERVRVQRARRAAGPGVVADLEHLTALHASGALSDEEFARAKDAVLDAAADDQR